jgi:hypothetical protein
VTEGGQRAHCQWQLRPELGMRAKKGALVSKISKHHILAIVEGSRSFAFLRTRLRPILRNGSDAVTRDER